MDPCGKMLGITPEQLINSMKAVMESEKHNERLLSLAVDPRQAEIIRLFLYDDKVSLATLQDLYRQMTCDPLTLPSISPPAFNSYLEGIKTSIMNKVKQFDYLLSLYFITTSETVQKVILFQAATILVHLRYLDYLLIKNLSKQSMGPTVRW